MRRGVVNVARVAAMLGGVFALAGCAASTVAPGDAAGSQAASSGAASVPASDAGDPALPEGWRWEGFGGVLVAVPGEWGWGTRSPQLSQWCLLRARKPPVVARPGPATAVLCPQDAGGVDPATLVANTGMVVAFEWALDDELGTGEGDQESRRIGDTLVRVNAPVRLREQILATVHEAQVDANGCPMHLEAGFEPDARPLPARDIATLTGVTSVAACRYPVVQLTEGATGNRMPVPLWSSLRLDGDAAQAAVAAIAVAPFGGGPDKPDSCVPDFSYGQEMIVARIESDQGQSAVHVYYSGCDHNGFDDGIALRALTRKAVQPLIAAPNRPLSWGGPNAKRRILDPRVE